MRIHAAPTAGVAVLNASFEPMGIVPLRRALIFLAHERAIVIEARPGERIQAAGGAEFKHPRVIVFREMVRTPSTYRPMPWSKRGMLVRDERRCGYCDRRGDTVDHILPRSRGGTNTWSNTITACQDCNGRKADRTPAEAGMTLLRIPRVITRRDTLVLGIAQLGVDLELIGLTV